MIKKKELKLNNKIIKEIKNIKENTMKIRKHNHI